ncbi:iron uptake porin [Gloeobacter kilaueensis]|uniref:SLH domain-containing protein n=1 Tax=Gloeobacter kilaueensis (strain ATCC BAA-2537 / CCAP 1431/1 / ULC 316 / JS1) TaxID=1183438 RepID=U5QLJ8_GLOK1|nr:iron uptake porin [Gloeobacter kilaueensis]AGY59832.1 hypothetical protein GKIL_3586 [Gloeobacter kilaueensis JS1]
MGVHRSELAWALGLVVGLVCPVFAAPQSDIEIVDAYMQGSHAQVNSVSELSDVDPNSWAFQALKSVVERYGCLEGYPNKTYLGSRPLSRYEFAAGLNACLEKVNELIAAATADKVSKEDLANLKQLQEEFRNELTALRGRVDALEAKTRDIESKLFSTTAKLDGSVVMAVTGGGGSNGSTIFSGAALGVGSAYGDALGARAISGTAANVSFVARTTLNLRATITGDDELLIRLRGVTGQAIDAVYPGIASGFGTLFYGGSAGGSFDGSTAVVRTDGTASVTFDKVRYIKRLAPNFRLFGGPRIEMFEFIDNNSFANNDESDFSSGRFIVSPLVNFVPFGSGGGFDWDITPTINWRALYLAASGGAASAFGSGGLFGGSNTVATQLEFDFGKASVRFIYSRFGEQGAALGTALPGIISNSYTDVFAANVEWAIVPQFALFGRYGYGTTNVHTLAGSPVSFSNINSDIYRVGFTLPDLFGIGNAFGFAYGAALRVNSGSVVGLTAPGVTTSLVPTGREGEIEIFYRIRLSDRLTITPDVQWILQPVNSVNSNGLAVYTLRTVFNF